MKPDMQPQEIGRRIAAYRKFKGFSQEELAQQVQISRSSLTQIELGKRNLQLIEFQRIANILGFSLDKFLSENFAIGEELAEPEAPSSEKAEVRISVPHLQLNKFKHVLLYILERCAGKPNVGETVLNKLLYFSDFNYYELYEEHLTGATYKKLPYGPVPQQLTSIIDQMIEQANLKRVKAEYHGYTQTRYLPLVKADLTQLKASEKEVLDHVIDQFSDWSATSISNYSHKDMPWLASKEGEVMDYELVFYRDVPFSVRNYEEETEEA
jgi:transcriptional regulator with XRE-family HTH domain